MSSKQGAETGKGSDAAAIFLAGSCSGIITSSVLQPLDVIKTHLMAEHYAGRLGKSASPLKSTLATVVKNILQKEGVRGLWRGTGPTCIRVGLGAGLYFLMLDRVMAGMRKLHETRLQTADTNRAVNSTEETSGRQNGVAPMPAPILIENLIQPDESLVETEPSTSGREGLPADKSSAKADADAGRGLPALYTMTAGAVTRSTAAALLCPITVVKTRMEEHVPRGGQHIPIRGGQRPVERLGADAAA